MKLPWKPLTLALLNAFGLGCDSRPTFTQAEVDAAVLGQGFPAGFLLGTATAAHQVEGGNTNDWTQWEATSFPDGTPHIKDHSVSGAADDSWNRFDTDLALMKQLGVNAYRFSVEWSRWEPTEGSFDPAVEARYLDWATRLRAAGIQPMVTIYHFTLPQWVAAQGGWQTDATLDKFERFAARVATVLGGQVDWWCTVNEPNVLATQAYLKGIWPPGIKDQKTSGDVLSRLLQAHARAAKQIRLNDTVDADGDGKATMIGIAHHVRLFQPASSSILDNVIASLTDDFFNDSVMNAVRTGHIHLSVPGAVSIDRDVPDLKGSIDYVGLNYYTRDHVRANLSDPSLSTQFVPAGRPTSDLGWDIYPEGMYLFLKRYGNLGLPVIITENGIADASGEKRSEFLRQHFYAIQRAIQDGVDVRGYFHWSLLDNFEWAEGYGPKFGLYTVDFSGPPYTRAKTPAVDLYQQIARNLGLSPQP